MDEDVTLGALIRQLRTEKGWSQRKLAAEAGMSPQFLSDIERSYFHPKNGATRPSDENVKSLAKALDVPAVRLHAALGRIDIKSDLAVEIEADYQQEKDLEEQGRFFARYKDLSPRSQRIVNKLIEELDSTEGESS